MARKVVLSQGARPAPADVDLGLMAESVGFQLRQASYAVHQAFGKRFSPADAVPRQYSVLYLISINPGVSVKDLAAAIGVDQSTLVPTLNVCEARGWIRRERRTADRRLVALALTGEGRSALAALHDMLAAHEASLTGELTADERKRLLSMLRRVRAAAERQLS